MSEPLRSIKAEPGGKVKAPGAYENVSQAQKKMSQVVDGRGFRCLFMNLADQGPGIGIQEKVR
jgi:hypothetical protein